MRVKDENTIATARRQDDLPRRQAGGASRIRPAVSSAGSPRRPVPAPGAHL